MGLSSSSDLAGGVSYFDFRDSDVHDACACGSVADVVSRGGSSLDAIYFGDLDAYGSGRSSHLVTIG